MLAKRAGCGLIEAMDDRPTRKLDTLQRIELAEGVEIQLRLAGPTVRGLAWMLDFAIKSCCFVVLLILAGIFGVFLSVVAGGEVGGGMAAGVLLLIMFVLDWIYSVAFEVSKLGGTPGKRAFGLRVAQTSGAPITLQQAVIRNLIRGIDFLPFGGIVGLVSCIMTRRFQRLGDLAADTVVIHDRETAACGWDPHLALEGVRSQRPPLPLTREEQQAVLEFARRCAEWEESRQREVAGHARLLTGVEENRAVGWLLGLAKWIRTEG